MSDNDFIRRGDALNAIKPIYGWSITAAEGVWDAIAALPAVTAPVAMRPSDPAHIVEYTNYRGETARRVIIPIRMWWGKTEWHPEEQWMLTAWDVEKNASRDFAWQDMQPVQNPATSAARIMAAIDAPDVAELVEAKQERDDAMALTHETIRQLKAAKSELLNVEFGLADPVAVHQNMLRGTIAKPTVEQIIHLYGVDALCRALAPVIVREAEAALPAQGVRVKPPFHFDRYVNGVLMAEGVTIERESHLADAARVASRIASKGPNGEAPVLVLAALTTEKNDG